MKSIIIRGGWAAKKAQLALDFEASYKQGKLSSSEYKELLEDLIHTDSLDKESNDIEAKTILVVAIKALIQGIK